MLALCAAAAAAALAHVAIDIIGDYALRHDTYDDVAHGSRGLVTGLGLLIAGILAARGLRVCFDIAAANRKRIPEPGFRRAELVGFIIGVAGLSAVIVPAMEWLDGRLSGVPVKELDDAFGGSILLGLSTTIVCAALVAAFLYAIVRWLICHRDVLAAIIETLLLRGTGCVRPSSHDLVLQRFTPRRRRAPQALRLCKRGPPDGAFFLRYPNYTTTEGVSRELYVSTKTPPTRWHRCLGRDGRLFGRTPIAIHSNR
jgi:hypothetical protein